MFNINVAVLIINCWCILVKMEGNLGYHKLHVLKHFTKVVISVARGNAHATNILLQNIVIQVMLHTSVRYCNMNTGILGHCRSLCVGP